MNDLLFLKWVCWFKKYVCLVLLSIYRKNNINNNNYG